MIVSHLRDLSYSWSIAPAKFIEQRIHDIYFRMVYFHTVFYLCLSV